MGDMILGDPPLPVKVPLWLAAVREMFYEVSISPFKDYTPEQRAEFEEGQDFRNGVMYAGAVMRAMRVPSTLMVHAALTKCRELEPRGLEHDEVFQEMYTAAIDAVLLQIINQALVTDSGQGVLPLVGKFDQQVWG